MDDFRLFLQEQKLYQKQQATQMANSTEMLAGLVTQNINNTPTSSQPYSSSTRPSQPLPNPKGSINASSFHEDSFELEVANDDKEEFLKMLEEISMKDDVGFEESEGIIKLGDGKQEDMPKVTYPSTPPSNDLMWDKKGKKDKGKLDEPGKKNNMKTNGMAENVSYMEWNHSTNLSILKGQPLEFHHDHSHNKGVDAYLVKDTSKWK
ncbi:hypothetical protein PIB30_102758 [Stylosanthes scabra]|uniref:Uncharacterized protein n=1 Tax=Stylosanthes scabra TaxID=79078 RepID=A0ABU6TZT2_9FABA|nr:hypothetical protein [Stylosanthes scabra]